MTLDRTPTTDAQWARAVERRLRRLETPSRVTLGTWDIHVSTITGDLIADHVPTGRRITIAAAEPHTPEEQ